MHIVKSVFILCLFFVTSVAVGQDNSLVFPKNDQTLSSNFVIEWNSNKLADQYNLKISTDSNFNTIIADYYQNTSSKLFQINTNSAFYWKVYYLNNSVIIDSSETSMFLVFAPSDLDSLNLWVKADSNVVITNGTISQWGDLSDSISNLLQSLVTRQPIIVNDGINNFPVVDFDAVDDRLQTTVDLSQKNFSISSVYSSKVQNSGIRMVNGTTNWIYGPFSGVHRVFNGGFVGGKAVVANKFVVHTAVSRNDTLNNYVNSTYYGQRKNSYLPGILTVGNNPVNGQVAEMVIVNGELLEVDRLMLDNYLMDKYAPPINLGKDMDVCNLPIQLSAYKDSYSDYTWSSGSTDSIISINSSGKYYVTVTDIFDRVSVDSVIIQRDTINFIVDLGADTVICKGQNLRIDAGNPLYSYQWNINSTESSITVDTSFNYRVTVTDCNGNTSIDSILVTVSDPAFSLGTDTSICFNASLIVEPNRLFSGANFLWSTGVSSNSITVSDRNSYALTVTDQFTCSFSDTLFVNSDSTIYSIDLGNDTSLCSGNQIGLISPIAGVDSYLWSTNSVDSFIIANATQKYYVTINESGCQNTDSINVIIKGDAPIADFSFTNQCNQDTTLFVDNSTDPQGININSYTWSFGDNSSTSLKDPTHYYTLPGTYSVTLNVTNDSNCTGVSQKTVEIHPKPTANFTNQTSCERDSTTFSSSSVVLTGSITNYHWNFGVGGMLSDTSNLENPSFIFLEDSTHSVQLEVETDNGCLDTLTKAIFVNAKPDVSFSFLGTIIGDSTQFTNTSTIGKGIISTYSWSLGNGLSTMDINPKTLYANKGVYYIQLDALSDSGCFETVTDSIRIIDPPPSFKTIFPKSNQSISADVTFVWNTKDSANNYTLELAQDSAFTSLIFSQNVIGQQLLVNNTYPFGKYYWRVKGLRNLVITDTTNVSAFQFFNPSAVDSLNLWLKANEGVINVNNKIQSWLDQSDSNLVLSQLDSNKRPVIENNALNGFPVANFDNVNDQLTTPLNLVGRDFLISSVYNSKEQNRGISMIRGSSNWIFGPFSGFYRVFNGGFLIGKPVEPFKYVLQTAASVDDTTSNYINNQFFGSRQNSFSPGLMTIGANAINGNIAEIIIVNGKSSDAERESIDHYLLDKYAPPVNLGADIKVCSFPDSIELSMDYAEAYLWSTGDTTSTLVVIEEGKYLVTVTDIFDRESIDSVYFILDTASFELNFPYRDTTICLGNKFEVTAGSNNRSYQWSTGETSPKIELNRDLNYVVTVTGCSGQVEVDSILVNVNNPSFNLGMDTTICHNGIISLQPDSNFMGVSYVWSTNQVSNSILANQSDSYSLTVTDNFMCSFADTIAVVIDSTIFGLTLGPDTTICKGNIIELLNPTTAITSYSWSTGEITNFATIDTSGMYKVLVHNSICSTRDTIVVTLKGDAPLADFNSSNYCFNDSSAFVDASIPPVGDNLVRWSWDFGDGTNTTIQNPLKRYSSVKNYTVVLEVETDKGCIDTVQKIVTIEPLPTANFNFQSIIHCAKESIFHEDSSSVRTGNITNYNWNFGDPTSAQNLTTLKDPFHTYDTLGAYIVSLSVETDKGCKDTTQKIININATPNVNYSFFGNCLSDSVRFFNQTTLANGSVLDYKWDIFRIGRQDFIGLPEENPTVKFNESGTYLTQLRVRTNINGLPGCESTNRDTIKIFDSPVADFNLPIICEADSFQVIDNSISIDSLITYQYVFDSSDTLFTKEATFAGRDDGVYTLQYTVTSENGCVSSVQKNVEINPKPEVNFSILNNNTGIPFSVDIDNRTLGANNYVWDFGNGDSSLSIIPQYVYQDTGSYQLKLVATSIFGCQDSLSQTLVALSEFLDAALTNVFLTENNLGDIEVSFQIVNTGFNTITDLQSVVDINNEFEFRETFTTKVHSGNTQGFQMNSSFIPDAGRKVDFVCVRIQTVNNQIDSILTNNELCEKGFNDELRLDVFPNPVEDNLNLQYALPDDGDVTFEVIDALGRVINKGFKMSQQEGYYTTIVRMGDLERGIYYYRFIFNGNETTGKFLKR